MPSAVISIQHRIDLFPQPTGMTCWSAAVTMLFGTRFSAGPGRASLSKGGLKGDLQNVHQFAQSYGLRVHPLQSWSAEGLVKLVRNGPAAMLGAIPSLHAVVLGGIRSDGSPDGTELTIYDPWPPQVGTVFTCNYLEFMSTFPLATIYVLQHQRCATLTGAIAKPSSAV